MKKIILCIVVMLTVLCGVARADLRGPDLEFEKRWRNLPLPTRLEKCRKMIDLPFRLGNPSWNLREWDAMQCSAILSPQEFLQACKNLESRCDPRVPFLRCPGECQAVLLKEQQEQTRKKHLVYGFIGLGVLLICGLAAWLLLRARKQKPSGK